MRNEARGERDEQEGVEIKWEKGGQGRTGQDWAGREAGCRNVSHACPLDDLASLECGRYWK